jgi:chemotaxis protein methyltransferase CheR
MAIDRAHIDAFRTMVAERLGLSFEDGKLDYLADILRSCFEASHEVDCPRYLGRLAGRPHWRDEWQALAEKLTVAETYFFRYWDHFRAFVDVVLPAYTGPNGLPQELRILSAGCASGEEAYSLAILIRERRSALAGAGPVTLVGIDVNPATIRKAVAARYSPWSLRETPLEMRERHFRIEGRDFVLNEDLRSMAKFEERNLIEPDPGFWRPNSFDVVFCRNVTMYFAPEVARMVMARISQSLAPGGYLFLGHAEALRGVSEGYDLKHTHGTFYYQLRTDRESRPSAVPYEVPALPASYGIRAAGLLDSNGSWFELIRRASKRITDLAAGKDARVEEESLSKAERVAPVPRGARRTWDSSIVLELLHEERYSDAMKLLSALPPDSYQDPDAQLLRAVILTNAGDLVGAKDACTQILAADELNAGAHYLLALCLEHEGNRETAVEHDQSAAYLDASFAMPRFHLGLLSKRGGSLEVAKRELEQALVLLAREDSTRILLFGGGFSRDALVELCRGELRSCGGEA